MAKLKYNIIQYNWSIKKKNMIDDMTNHKSLLVIHPK